MFQFSLAPFASVLTPFWIHSPLSTTEGRFFYFRSSFCHCFASTYSLIFSGLPWGSSKIECCFWSFLLFLAYPFPWEDRYFWRRKLKIYILKRITFGSRSSHRHTWIPEYWWDHIGNQLLFPHLSELVYWQLWQSQESRWVGHFKNVENFNKK